ncbi:MAG: ABC transporter ATP-binding protein [Gammaproteobacteria bacterium]|nr:ABC transporter ATP-binding protein [Gammaproteobacteria bacterium]
MSSALLEVSGLKTWLGRVDQPLRAVDGIGFTIQRGETFALLGESGCGKSMTALSLLGLNPLPVSRIVDGEVKLAGLDLLQLSEAEMQAIRGRRIAMIFQEPQSSLNPVLSVGEQISECLNLHFDLDAKASQQRVIELLESVGIPDPLQRIKEYPHQLSGGMKQRVMIAMALAGEPELLIADEPTTALDVTIQAQILELLKTIQRDTGMAILLISHDLAVVAQMADHVAVMYAGQIVETASRQQFFEQHQHPYTDKLFQALPSEQKRDQRLTVIKGSVPVLTQDFKACRFVERCDHAWDLCRTTPPLWTEDNDHGVRCHLFNQDADVERTMLPQTQYSSPLSEVLPAERNVLTVQNLKVHFPIRKGVLQRVVGQVRAVDGVSLSLKHAETVALVGESGCGKTTVGKGILQLVPVTDGDVEFHGHRLNGLPERALKQHRSSLQIVFQDPYSSMNPRMTISQIIEEGLSRKQFTKDSEAKEKRINELLERVGLRAEIKHRYPHEFSGGQRQRICIARALAAEPEIIICDEPTSALDVSVQAQILNLLREIQHEFGLSYLFITHNIAVVNYLAHRVAVMYLGRIVEQGSRDDVLHTPKHPYTQALLAAVPELDLNTTEEVTRLEGELPSPAKPPKGCHFHQRCPQAMPKCLESYPEHTQLSTSHEVRCFLYEESE